MRRTRRSGSFWSGVAAAAVVAAGVVALAVGPGGAIRAQGPAARGKAAGANPNVKNKGLRPLNPPQRKAPPNAGDPLAKQRPADPDKTAGTTFHYRMKVHGRGGATLAASYYPGRPDVTTPVVLLVHDKDRSGKDFEDPITELKGKGFAEHLQSLGYAVLAFDLRGHGANPRRPAAETDWRDMPEDLQSAYVFLLDRHNRGELNLARLGVVALGEGANLAAAWAALPGGGVSHEGRVTDVAALALVSPMPVSGGTPFSTLMNTLAARIPVLLVAGDRDVPSHDAVARVRATVERTRQNRVELVPSALHGYKLLRLEPKVTSTLERFLEATVKLKAVDWEPRYNLTPVTYSDIQVVRHVKPTDQDKARARAGEPEGKEKAKAKEKEREKARGKDGGEDEDAGKAKAKADEK